MQDGKYYAASGTTGYRWMESELVKNMPNEGMDTIDQGYYHKLVDDAVEAVSKYCDFEWFTSDEPYQTPFMNIPEDVDDVLPFAETA